MWVFVSTSFLFPCPLTLRRIFGLWIVKEKGGVECEREREVERG